MNTTTRMTEAEITSWLAANFFGCGGVRYVNGDVQVFDGYEKTWAMIGTIGDIRQMIAERKEQLN